LGKELGNPEAQKGAIAQYPNIGRLLEVRDLFLHP
jgi:hypothetical protein